MPEWLTRQPDRRTFAAIVVGASLLFVGSCGLLHLGFYKHGQLRDTQHYWVYGAAVVRGYVPYRDYPVAYPPGALPVFILPAIGHDQPKEYPGYRGIFAWIMVVAGVLVILFMGLTLRTLRATTGRIAGALAFAGLAPLAVGSLLLSRYDLYAALFATAGLALLVAGRRRTGSAVLAIGTVTKLYPALLLPLTLVDTWRRNGRHEALQCAAIFGGMVAAIIIPFVAISPGGTWWMLDRQLTRPLQIESFGSSVLLVLHHAFGLGVTTGFSAGSQNLVGGLPDGIALFQSLLLIAVLIVSWIIYARSPSSPELLVQFAAIGICAYVALGKVLSPQYLIWLAPVVPLVRGRRGLIASALLALALVLTQLWFPHHYFDLARRLEKREVAFVFERDAVLIALLLLLAWPAAPARDPGRSTCGSLASR